MAGTRVPARCRECSGFADPYLRKGLCSKCERERIRLEALRAAQAAPGTPPELPDDACLDPDLPAFLSGD